MAEDADGPTHNRVRYAIMSGNQGSTFTIDAVKGVVKVARSLDREKVGRIFLRLPRSRRVGFMLHCT